MNKDMANICYHGTSAEPFDRFDLSHILEGDGKCKFGVGVYVTSVYRTAAHYSGAKADARDHYVYTVEIPARREDNCLGFKEPVHPEIVRRASDALGITIPPEACEQGSYFRKFLANQTTGNVTSVRKMISKADLEGEKSAARFLSGIGVELLCWPYNWKNPEAGTNYAVLDDRNVRILRIDRVQLDAKDQLIDGSQETVREFQG